MSITLGQIITTILFTLSNIAMIGAGVAVGIYIMRRVFEVSIENTYIIEDNSICVCDEEGECEGCPMSGKCCKEEVK